MKNEAINSRKLSIDALATLAGDKSHVDELVEVKDVPAVLPRRPSPMAWVHSKARHRWGRLKRLGRATRCFVRGHDWRVVKINGGFGGGTYHGRCRRCRDGRWAG